ncbi:hypothetical protein [Jiella sp. M17.18]|uniref:hypothetical protein n=1 Tax=Jiella sp. M17.18 TaxID=3234247 RepID=UPI0034DF086B
MIASSVFGSSNIFQTSSRDAATSAAPSNVPTFKEQGYDIVDQVWRGIAVRADTPKDVVAAIQAAVDKVESSQKWLDFQKQEKQENINLAEPAFTKLAKGELEGQTKFLKSIGMIK